MNFKKVGIMTIIATLAFIYLTKDTDLDVYLRIALSVFGIGSGFVLILLDGYRHFKQ